MAEQPDVVLEEDHVSVRGSDGSSPVLDIEGENNWNLSKTSGDFRIGDSSNSLKMGVSLGGAGEGTARVQATSELKLGLEGNSSVLIDADGAHPHDSEDLGTPDTRWNSVHVENSVHVGSSYDGSFGPSEGVVISDDLTQIPTLHVKDWIEGDLVPRQSEPDLGSSDRRWGTVYAQNINTPSDARLKTAIEPLEGGLDAVLNLRPVSYKWKGNSGERDIGLVGQEVAEVLPDVVSDGADDDGYLGLDYTKIVPVLIDAIQQQQAKKEGLAERVESQEARIKNLEERLVALEDNV